MTAHPIDTEALRRLADAATPGPWEPRTDDLTDEVDVWANGDKRDSHVAFVGMPEEPRVHADAEFIAAARTAIPALLDALAAAEARATRAEAQSEARRINADYWRARVKAVEDVLETHTYTGTYSGQERVATRYIRDALDGDS